MRMKSNRRARSVKGKTIAAVAVLIAGFSAGAALAASPTVFDIFDSAVVSMVASGTCHTADPATFSRFTKQFNGLYSQVEDELLGMNPGKNRSDMKMLIGFRTAQLELKTEKSIQTLGCSHPDIQAAARLLDSQTSMNM